MSSRCCRITVMGQVKKRVDRVEVRTLRTQLSIPEVELVNIMELSARMQWMVPEDQEAGLVYEYAVRSEAGIVESSTIEASVGELLLDGLTEGTEYTLTVAGSLEGYAGSEGVHNGIYDLGAPAVSSSNKY